MHCGCGPVPHPEQTVSFREPYVLIIRETSQFGNFNYQIGCLLHDADAGAPVSPCKSPRYDEEFSLRLRPESGQELRAVPSHHHRRPHRMGVWSCHHTFIGVFSSATIFQSLRNNLSGDQPISPATLVGPGGWRGGHVLHVTDVAGRGSNLSVPSSERWGSSCWDG